MRAQLCEIPSYRREKCQLLGGKTMPSSTPVDALTPVHRGKNRGRPHPKEKGAGRLRRMCSKSSASLSQTFLSLYSKCVSAPLCPADIHREWRSGTWEVCSETHVPAARLQKSSEERKGPGISLVKRNGQPRGAVGIIKLLCPKAHGVNLFICILWVLSFRIM